ncbi:Metabotropic glutamate receptor-like protein B [Hondaea fermentalgiana]|uniref:Metabotropic glutamate receptor-like protein B n=1 Tax=Hondaea fermentalgiana TaxID=2315210 RepID=A0A2R5GSJ3_9STRA|nr:Metabotropic glutamate receptor-like protein B [Hondaea fermentalgiana]|eukprot:GBG31341.1 Metabotropic glutamate receptor-like protein B [Hondaea fermentalgiana]
MAAQGCKAGPKMAMAALALLLASSQAPQIEALHIVQVLPLTGSASHIGSYYKHGYAMYFDEIGHEVNWDGETLSLDSTRLVLVDSESDAEKGAANLDGNLTEILKWDDDVFVLGGYSSTRIATQIEVANKHSVPYVNGGGATAAMYETSSENPLYGKNDGKWAFGLLSPVEFLTDTVLEFMKTSMDNGVLAKPCDIALVWENGTHGDAFREEVSRYTLLYPDYFHLYYATNFPYPIDTTDEDVFKHLETDMEIARNTTRDSSRCHALMADTHSTEFRMLLDTFSTTNVKFDFATFGARGVDIEDIHELEHPAFVQDLVAALWWSVSQKPEISRNWAQRWRLFEAYAWADEAFEEDASSTSGGAASTTMFTLPENQLAIEWYAALAYESARVLVQSLENANSASTKSVRSYMQKTSFTNSIIPGGTIKFNANGQAEYEMTLVQADITILDEDETNVELSVRNLYPPAEKTGELTSSLIFGAEPSNCTMVGFVQAVATSCEDDSREVIYFWADREGRQCPDPNEPCACDNTFAQIELPTTGSLQCPYVPYKSLTGRILISLSSIGAIICYIFLFVVLRHYSSVAMKAGQREFLVLMCFAGIWCNVAAMSFLGPNQTNKCRTRIANLALSLTLLVGSLTVKVYRIWRIWNNSTMRRISISAFFMFKILMGIMFGMTLLLIVWFAVDAPQAMEASLTNADVHLYQITGLHVTFSANVCVYFGGSNADSHNEYIVFPVLGVVYVVLILLYTTFLSYQGRNSDAKYMESRSIMMASYVTTMIIFLTMILVAGLPLEVKSQTFLISSTLVFTSLILILLVIGPKVYFVTAPEFASVSRAVKKKIGSGSRQTSAPGATTAPRTGTQTGDMTNLTGDITQDMRTTDDLTALPPPATKKSRSRAATLPGEGPMTTGGDTGLSVEENDGDDEDEDDEDDEGDKKREPKNASASGARVAAASAGNEAELSKSLSMDLA